MRGPRIVAELANRLVAVEMRHHQIDQYQVGHAFLRHAHGLIAILCDQHIIALAAEHNLEKLAYCLFVIRNKDTLCHIGDVSPRCQASAVIFYRQPAWARAQVPAPARALAAEYSRFPSPSRKRRESRG